MLIAKEGKPFTEAEFVQKCVLSMAGNICPDIVHKFEEVPLSVRSITRRIEDVGESTKDLVYEIFALKTAPIQVKLLGHHGNSGAIDYLVTDEQCSQSNLDYLYTEKLAYLNRTVFFGDHKLLFNDLRQNRTTNRNNYNGTMGIFKRDVKNSVLWLLPFVEDTENNIHEYFELNGIDPVRIIFSNIALKAEHLRRIQLAYVYLDTPFYNGYNSCLDALWAGTPIVTLSGDTFVARMTTSQLTVINCTELIALTEVDYTKIAIQLEKHTYLLDQIKQQIWQLKTTSVLFDCKSYCNELENLYLDMWTKLF
ncbi:O-GlcNAc transferase, C-terminal [Cinara cedri]|uniref:O-GlcNAc transferase, C-terminal n=1 Tax=Cinara cedri TaxID=506608 RepID=A0A5E4NGL0_9HEMI|nr:O-GlcNAc transferase, C-terminal [Cinara cedri]